MYSLQYLKCLPTSLELLLRGQKEAETDKQSRQGPQRQAYSEEAHMMELLANKDAGFQMMGNCNKSHKVTSYLASSWLYCTIGPLVILGYFRTQLSQ
jgi:hypothetical protein